MEDVAIGRWFRELGWRRRQEMSGAGTEKKKRY